jgi:mRNA-degrading endonuclease RelE of RelBE toxin-antitoxin system
MVTLVPSKDFEKKVKHLDPFNKEKLEKQIRKILNDPEVGKPLKYTRGERVLYVKPFRLVYAVRGDEIILLNFDHRKRVYK